MNNALNDRLVREAKSIVALAFRNGPIEDVHAGKMCPACHGQSAFSHMTDAEMKAIMKNAVDRVYALLCLKLENPAEYESQVEFGGSYTARWDDPAVPASRLTNYRTADDGL